MLWVWGFSALKLFPRKKRDSISSITVFFPLHLHFHLKNEYEISQYTFILKNIDIYGLQNLRLGKVSFP